ncbi:MAG: LamG-like jellyroll fold domain-containing protein, partial [Verrucomicrobiota bacterium]
MKPRSAATALGIFSLFWMILPLSADLTDGLIAHWPLDEVTGTVTPDVVNGYDITLVNLSADDLVEGKRGNAMLFNNGRRTLLEYLAEEGDLLPVNDQFEHFSVSVWVKGKGTGQNDLRFFAEASTASNNPLFNMGTQNNGQADTIDMYIRPPGRHEWSESEPLDDTWRHVVWVEGENSIALYIDGVADTRADWSVGEFSAGALNTTSIGGIRRASASHWWTGAVDDVGVWNRSLTDGEVQELFENGLVGGDPNLSVNARDLFINLDEGPTTREVTLANLGETQTLTITGAVLTGDDRDLFTLGAFPDTLAPGEEAVMAVTFDPAGRKGGVIASLELTSNDEKDPVTVIDLSTIVPSTNQLVAHYRMDETSGNTMLDSAFLKHGEYAAGGGSFEVDQEPLAAGRSVNFVRAGDAGGGYGQARLGGDSLTSFSVSMWVRKDDNALSAIFSKGIQGETPVFAALFDGSNLLWFNEENQQEGIADLTPGENLHLVFSYTDLNGSNPGADHLAIYVNGEEALSLDSPPAVVDDPGLPLLLGSYYGTLGFQGAMDDVQIYAKAITAGDAKFLF